MNLLLNQFPLELQYTHLCSHHKQMVLMFCFIDFVIMLRLTLFLLLLYILTMHIAVWKFCECPVFLFISFISGDRIAISISLYGYHFATNVVRWHLFSHCLGLKVMFCLFDLSNGKWFVYFACLYKTHNQIGLCLCFRFHSIYRSVFLLKEES